LAQLLNSFKKNLFFHLKISFMKAHIASLRSLFLLIMLCFTQAMLFAQDNSGGGGESGGGTSKTEVNITADGGEWYTSPWVWIVGAAVFILLLVALTSSGRKRSDDTRTDKVTVTKTVSRDSDV
jgi:preprotein translocase subunit SecG